MLNKIGMSIMFLAAFAALPPAARAASPVLRARIPFEFIAAGRTLPAGDYHIVMQPRPEVFLLRAVDGRHSVALIASQGRLPRNQPWTGVVFHRYGKRAFFAGFHVDGQRTVRRVLPCRLERELSKSAPNAMTPIMASVNLNAQ